MSYLLAMLQTVPAKKPKQSSRQDEIWQASRERYRLFMTGRDVTAKELAVHLHCHPSVVARTLDTLHALGSVRRGPDRYNTKNRIQFTWTWEVAVDAPSE